jgi:hypothetical protein
MAVTIDDSKSRVLKRFPKAVCVKQPSGAYLVLERRPVKADTKWLGWGHNKQEAWERAEQGLSYWDGH